MKIKQEIYIFAEQKYDNNFINSINVLKHYNPNYYVVYETMTGLSVKCRNGICEWSGQQYKIKNKNILNKCIDWIYNTLNEHQDG